MNVLVIGDVHGCFYTLKKLVKKHWNPNEEILIQLGDLVNKGPHSAKCLKYWQKLEKKHAGKCVLLRGNHEQFLINNSKGLGDMITGKPLVYQLESAGISLKKTQAWLQEKPLFWKNDHLLVSHAGVGKQVDNPFNDSNKEGVLYQRGPLKCLDKTQVKGHNVLEGNKPVFNPAENAWYIDTGAWVNKYLSAIRFTSQGKMLNIIREEVKGKDQVI